MVQVIDKEILDELREVAKKFKNEESTLDIDVIESNSSFRVTRFELKFPTAMAKFRLLDLAHKGEYSSEYRAACEAFLDLVTTAKSNKIIVKRSDQQELNRLKERNHTLDSDLHKCEIDKKSKEEELSNLKALIKAVSKTNTFLKPFFSIEESKAEDTNEQPS